MDDKILTKYKNNLSLLLCNIIFFLNNDLCFVFYKECLNYISGKKLINFYINNLLNYSNLLINKNLLEFYKKTKKILYCYISKQNLKKIHTLISSEKERDILIINDFLLCLNELCYNYILKQKKKNETLFTEYDNNEIESILIDIKMVRNSLSYVYGV